MRLKKGCAAMKCFKQSLEVTMECGMGEKHNGEAICVHQ